jgi:hypothetical protein
LQLTWEESVKRYLKYWCITKELALDRREWKLVIHVAEPWSSVPFFYCLFSSFFLCPFFVFWLSVLLSFLSFWFSFLSPFIFFLIFQSCFVPSLTHVVSSLVYPNLLENKMLSCCCCWMCYDWILLQHALLWAACKQFK